MHAHTYACITNTSIKKAAVTKHLFRFHAKNSNMIVMHENRDPACTCPWKYIMGLKNMHGVLRMRMSRGLYPAIFFFSSWGKPMLK
jgi:hypothetical protein